MSILPKDIRHRHTTYNNAICLINLLNIGFLILGDKYRTTIRLSKELHEAVESARKNEGFELSLFVREMLSKKFFDDSPFFIESQIKEIKKQIQCKKKEIKRLEKKLEKAEKKQEERKKRLNQYRPQMKTYRKRILSKKEE